MSTQKWNSRIMFPTDSNFVCRIIEATFAPSNSTKNPMLTLEYEIVSPEEVEIGTEKYSLAGVNKIKTYHVTKVIDESDPSAAEEKTLKMRGYLTSTSSDNPGLFVKLGITEDQINWDNLDTKLFLGKMVLCMMSPDITEQRANPTAAETAEAKRLNKKAEGKILKNPVSGKPLVNYFPKVREVFGLASSDGMVVAY